MPSIALYLKTHQPFRIKHYRAFEVGHDHEYFNDTSDKNTNNVKILKKICEKSLRFEVPVMVEVETCDNLGQVIRRELLYDGSWYFLHLKII